VRRREDVRRDEREAILPANVFCDDSAKYHPVLNY
jgi:hypothetical protein